MAETSTPDAWEEEVVAAWGLNLAPFSDAATEAFFFPGEQHLRVLDFMRRVLCSQVSAGVITGARGTGKSLLVRHFVSTLDDRILLAHVQRTDMSSREFLYEVLRQIGVNLEPEDRTDRRLLLQRYLTHQVSNGRICLLIVENAQSMQPAVLDELLHLASIQLDGARLLKMLLLGQPMLARVVDSPRLQGLVPANVPRVTLTGLSEDQLAAYVAHRLRSAGAKDPDGVFAPALIPTLHRLTNGLPAAVNALCSRSLAVAAVDGENAVSEHSLLNAAVQLGYKLDVVAAPEPPPADPAGEALLIVSLQGGVEQVVSMDHQRIVIGRSEHADVQINSAFVSRYHALIVREPTHDVLVDLGSTNGITVNAKRVIRHLLKHRDLIQIGAARISYLNSSQQPLGVVDIDQTMNFSRIDAANAEHSVFAFGRFEDAG